MPRSVTIHPGSLAVGLLLGLASWISMSQVAIPRAPSWGPPKEDIVNVFEEHTPVITIPPGGSQVIYTVPSDRWLVLTGVSAEMGPGYASRWAENWNGSVALKGIAEHGTIAQTPDGGGGAIGWTFHPGAQVVIANVDPTTTYYLGGFSLIGYLAQR